MHKKVYENFEKILADPSFQGLVLGNVLEIGAVPTADSLLASPTLQAAAKKIGINLDGGHSMTANAGTADRPHVNIVNANANDMSFFPDGEFHVVLSNATAEHDKFFWKTLAEMKRVLRGGGLMIVCVPGYARGIAVPDAPLATYTHRVHDWPGDYYRFSEQACREVFFDGFERVGQNVLRVGKTPKIITWGIKRQ